MRKIVTIMTALVPTVGHQYLLNFVNAFAIEVGAIAHVILCTRSHEPGIQQRLLAVKATRQSNMLHHYQDDDAPQFPRGEDDAAFWEYWRDAVQSQVGEMTSEDFFVASEPYGVKMAKVLGCQFVPCDVYREVVPARGTEVRENLWHHFDKVMPTFRHNLVTTVTVFGAESVGKTTMAKAMAGTLNGAYVHEWARQYLETVGAEVTLDKMRVICGAQAAAQRAARLNVEKPFVFMDTDLLSTLGYYRIYAKPEDYEAEKRYLETMIANFKSDLYVVMNSGIPFEPDQLRYGGDERESTDQFWIDLLEEYECEYYVVESTDTDAQLAEVKKACWDAFQKKNAAYTNFVRET